GDCRAAANLRDHALGTFLMRLDVPGTLMLNLTGARVFAAAALSIVLISTDATGREVKSDNPSASSALTSYRDGMGVPHVYAESSPALLYGASYAIAEDRLAQGEWNARRMLGRLSEIVGRQSIESDKEARLDVQTDAQLKAQFAALSPEHQAILK